MGMTEIEQWDLVKALCISDDGNTIAGYGKDPTNNWTGWVIRISVEQDHGDVNGDGDIDIADVLMVVTYLLGVELTDQELANADLDMNLLVDIFDLLALINIAIP
jgi:hypothetical protein